MSQSRSHKSNQRGMDWPGKSVVGVSFPDNTVSQSVGDNTDHGMQNQL